MALINKCKERFLQQFWLFRQASIHIMDWQKEHLLATMVVESYTSPFELTPADFSNFQAKTRLYWDNPHLGEMIVHIKHNTLA